MFIYGSRSLGYVNAEQPEDRALSAANGPHVLPAPRSSSDPRDPPGARRSPRLIRSGSDEIIEDLRPAASENLRRNLSRIDVWLWGHGMIRPTVGYIWGSVRAGMQEPRGRIDFAVDCRHGAGCDFRGGAVPGRSGRGPRPALADPRRLTPFR